MIERQMYAMYDPDPGYSGCLPITPQDAPGLNARGFGIFWSVNDFDGPRRLDNLRRINSWAVDLDGEDKPDQWARIKKHIVPSLVVETKSGFHVYFDASDATQNNYKAIVGDRLIPALGGDPRAKDVARILRVPGFLHHKDPLNPYKVTVVHQSDRVYTEQEMLTAFPLPKEEVMRRAAYRKSMASAGGETDFWERVYQLDQMEALERLSGTKWVNGERYTFRPVSRGHHNIYVDGRSTSCFIDEFGKIGSLTKGGPAVSSWLKWLGHDYKTIYRILSETFPEIIRTKRGGHEESSGRR